MQRCLMLILCWTLSIPAVGQLSTSSKYQPGTITAVVPHHDSAGLSDNSSQKYDVLVKVGNTIYTVLYEQPSGAYGVEYSAGLELLVKVEGNTLTFNKKASGQPVKLTILRRETLPSQPTLDLSKLPSQYFAMKQQHLTETLDLSEAQQAQIKPIAEQEAGEANAFLGNPVISREEQLHRWEKLVRASDNKIKPFLSPTQQNKLQEMRKEQREQLKQMIASYKTEKQN
jgi:hypothetical protein